jgi:uncharacterized protein
LRPEDFADAQFGLPTVKDILAELEKPGRDPRPEFKTAVFKEGVQELRDLEAGMLLEGNVANFGGFVDVGVHQDGLVHVSQLADRFVKDPCEIVKAGDIVKVKVVDVDLKRGRIALTMRLKEPGVDIGSGKGVATRPATQAGSNAAPAPHSAKPTTSMAAAFAILDASRSSDVKKPQARRDK